MQDARTIALPGSRLSPAKTQALLAHIVDQLGECETLVKTLEALVGNDAGCLRAVESRLGAVKSYIATWLLSDSRSSETISANDQEIAAANNDHLSPTIRSTKTTVEFP